jgi:hypothetical protein
MEDYAIKQVGGGEYTITTQTKRAENRPGGFRIGYTLVFKGRGEVRGYVEDAEAGGFTFEGKELLA